MWRQPAFWVNAVVLAGALFLTTLSEREVVQDFVRLVVPLQIQYFLYYWLVGQRGRRRLPELRPLGWGLFLGNFLLQVTRRGNQVRYLQILVSLLLELALDREF